MLSLSVIIPAYNIERYIERCLKSILNCQYDNIEIIIVDDESKDSTYQIAKRYSEKYQSIKVVRQKNGGCSVARNTGLKIAHGEVILFVDGDDWLDDYYIADGMKLLENSNADVLFTPYVKEYQGKSVPVYFLGKETKVFQEKIVKKECYQRLFGPIENLDPRSLENLNTAWGKFYRKAILNNICFLPREEIGLAEDLWFNLEVFSRVRHAIYYPKRLLHYNRANGNSIMAKYHENFWPPMKNLFNKMNSRIKNEKLESSFQQALANRIVLNMFSIAIQVSKSPLPFFKKKQLLKNILQDPVVIDAKEKVILENFILLFRPFYWCVLHNRVTEMMIFIETALKLTKALRR